MDAVREALVLLGLRVEPDLGLVREGFRGDLDDATELHDFGQVEDDVVAGPHLRALLRARGLAGNEVEPALAQQLEVVR